MRRLALLGCLTILLALVAIPARAATHAPCSSHGAVAPHVTLIANGDATIQGSGSISGCPVVTTTTSESVTLTVALQHQELGAWVTRHTAGPTTKAWNRYTRYARQHSLTATGTCLPGAWRTHVTGGDGYAPTAWDSAVVTFTLGDSGVCGAYGGGD